MIMAKQWERDNVKTALTITALFIGYIAGGNPAYTTPPDLLDAIQGGMMVAYQIGYEDAQYVDDVGLVRLTINEVEGLIK